MTKAQKQTLELFFFNYLTLKTYKMESDSYKKLKL